jgi:hypothetical protein
MWYILGLNGLIGSRNNTVDIGMGYGLGIQGRIPGRAKKFFSYSQHPDLLWSLPSLLYDGYRGSFLGGKAAGM